MKPVTAADKVSVEFGGLTETNAFTISGNAKAFRVLIDGLYSDKIRAIIRELCSNAFDAHAAAGCADCPFEVTLPTRWEPTFMIRDFGTGLDHDGVMRLYTTIFESTKEDTNREVGKFGLGSKSPFSYTDTFTVRSIQDGVARSYGAYIAADGVPQIALMGETETDEHRGFEVSFPVRSDDITTFADKLRRVGLGFDVKPVVFGVTDFAWYEHQPLCSGEGWTLLDTYDYGHTAQAKQGCVIYPIDADAIEGITQTQKGLLGCPLYIDFPIGAIDITPSRESLSYDAATQANIARRIAQIETEIIAIYDSMIRNAGTYWQAQEAYESLLSVTLPPAIKDIFRQKAEWRGRRVRSETRIHMRTFPDLEMSVTSYSDIRRLKRLHFNGHTLAHIGPANDSVIIFQDTNERVVKAAQRIHSYAHRHNVGVIWFRGPKNSFSARRLWLTLGRPPFLEVKDLHLPEQSRAPRAKTAKFKQRTLNDWIDVNVDPAAGGVFVDLRNNKVARRDGTVIGNPAFEATVDHLVDLGYLQSSDEVFAIPGTYKSIPDKHAGWTNLFDLVDEVVRANLDLDLYQAARDAQTTMMAVSRGVPSDMLAVLEAIHKVDPLPIFSPARCLYDRYRAIVQQSRAGDRQRVLVNLARLANHRYDFYEPITDVAFVVDMNNLIARYPMIQWALCQIAFLRSTSLEQNDALTLRQYILSVDSVSQSDDNEQTQAA